MNDFIDNNLFGNGNKNENINNNENKKTKLRTIQKQMKTEMEEAKNNIMVYVENGKLSLSDLIKQTKIPKNCILYYNIGSVWYTIKKHNYVIIPPNEEIIKCSIELQENDVYKIQNERQLFRATKLRFIEKTHIQPLIIYLIIKYNL